MEPPGIVNAISTARLEDLSVEHCVSGAGWAEQASEAEGWGRPRRNSGVEPAAILLFLVLTKNQI
jgi:hypothetical protein